MHIHFPALLNAAPQHAAITAEYARLGKLGAGLDLVYRGNFREKYRHPSLRRAPLTNIGLPLATTLAHMHIHSQNGSRSRSRTRPSVLE